MVQLNWSPDALKAVPNPAERAAMTELFQAYFRATGEDLAGTLLHLDLPSHSQSRYHFHAEFERNSGWTVRLELKLQHRELKF